MRPTELVLCDLESPNLDHLESWSAFTLKTHRALKGAGLSYTTRREQSFEAYLELNPLGQIPILVADGRPITDSTRILAAIRTWTGAPNPSEALLWEELADSALNGFTVAARWADPANWPRVRAAFFGPAPDEVVLPMHAGVMQMLVARDVWRAGPDACWSRFAELLDALDERAPREGFWLGEALTAADYGLFGQLHALRCHLTPGQAAQIAQRPRLTAWLDRVDAATR